MFEQKIHKELSNKAYNYNTFQQDLLKSQDTSLIACANCLQKKTNIEEKKPKSQAFFLTPTTSKKAKFVKFGVKKANLATLVSS